MSERYPDDSSLLALAEDAHSGVEYIATGKSPYFLEFRRLVQRLLLTAGRAGDLRVYQDGDLTIGVRDGRCVIGDAVVAYSGAGDVGVADDETTSVWLDEAGVLQTGTAGMPSDRTMFVPLADVVSADGVITSVTDRRGEAYLATVNLSHLGLSATVAEIDQALNGINGTVDATALNKLTGGLTSSGDGEHHHSQLVIDHDSETTFRVINNDAGSSANVGLVFDLPMRSAFTAGFLMDPSGGWMQQRRGTISYGMVGSVYAEYGHEGDLTGSMAGKLMGVVSLEGVIEDVVLSVGGNIVSSDGGDGVSATVKVNGVSVATVDAVLTDGAGSGHRSTGQGDGTPAVIKSDGTENVSRGDVLTVDLTRTANGTVSVEASDVVVLVVISVKKPI